VVNGEQLRSQRIIGLPFTVHCLPNALRSALTALRLGLAKSSEPGFSAVVLNYHFTLFFLTLTPSYSKLSFKGDVIAEN
jgi:hypothetical protein